jgi:hypothetical protein
MSTTRQNEIAFVDTRLENYQSLIDGLNPDTEVILISSGNGLQAMADALSGRSGVEVVHVFSHGNAGALQLGDITLTSANLNSYAPLLAQIGQSLTEEGDLLLYGCNVAQGETGQAFVESIARVTQADVAASEDLTGAAALGGDWVLESSAGSVEASAINSQDFSDVLAVNITEGDTTGTESAPANQFSGYEIVTQNVSSSAELAGAKVSSFSDGYPVVTDIPNTLTAGTYTITFRIQEIGLPATAFNKTLSVVVASANTAPTINGSTVNVTENTQGQFDLYAAAADAETADASLTYTVESGQGSINGQYLQYTPSADPSKKGSAYADEETVVKVSDGSLNAQTTVYWNVTYADDAPTGSVTATGTSKVAEQLTATNNISDVDDGGAGVAKNYQWQAYNTTNNTWEALAGETNNTFTPAAGDANKLVRVKITAGSPPTEFLSDVRLIAPATGPGLVNVTGLSTPITVKNPSGDTTVTNNNPNPSGTGVTLDGPEGGTTVTTSGNGPITVANPGGVAAASSSRTRAPAPPP